MRMTKKNSSHDAMTSLRRALIMVCVACICAIFLSPWFYRIAQHVPALERYDFRRVFTRVAGVAIILALVSAWRWIGVQLRFRRLLRRKRALRQTVFWFVIGVMTIGALIALQYYAQLRLYFLVQFGCVRTMRMYVFKEFYSTLGTGLAVALFEELFFRGYLLQACLQKFSRYRAIFLTSAIFAVVHIFGMDYFLGPVRHAEIDGTTWYAGFTLIRLFLQPLLQPQVYMPGLIGLFLAGWLLAEVTVRYNTLWPAIGTHWGWVFAIKFTNRIWKFHRPENLPEGHGPLWFFGDNFAATGVTGWIIISVIILCVNGLLVYALYRVVVAIASRCNHRSLIRFGRIVGRVMYLIAPGRRRLAIANIRAAFPEKTTDECAKIARESFETLAATGCEFVAFSHMTKHLDEYVDIPDYSAVQKAYDDGKGVIFFTGHFGNWELMGQVCGHVGFAFTGVARPLRNQWVYSHIQRVRTAAGISMLDKHGIAHEVTGRLKKGKAVGFVADQYAGSGGAFVPFFGRPASTSTAVARIARATGAPVVAGFDHRDANGMHRISLHPPLYASRTDDAEKDVYEMTHHLMYLLEQEIRRNPGMWVWAHRKWRARKTPPVTDTQTSAQTPDAIL